MTNPSDPSDPSELPYAEFCETFGERIRSAAPPNISEQEFDQLCTLLWQMQEAAYASGYTDGANDEATYREWEAAQPRPYLQRSVH